jgi:hypothetical protein
MATVQRPSCAKQNETAIAIGCTKGKLLQSPNDRFGGPCPRRARRLAAAAGPSLIEWRPHWTHHMAPPKRGWIMHWNADFSLPVGVESNRNASPSGVRWVREPLTKLIVWRGVPDTSALNGPPNENLALWALLKTPDQVRGRRYCAGQFRAAVLAVLGVRVRSSTRTLPARDGF